MLVVADAIVCVCDNVFFCSHTGVKSVLDLLSTLQLDSTY